MYTNRMRKHPSSLFLFFTMIVLLLTGCSQTPSGASSEDSSSVGTVPVSLSITDQPPAGVTVLFFQVSITSASLTPASGSANVSLLNNNTPIPVDVTQLQALSAFLSSANVPPGTYNSLSVTFANPQLVIFNSSDEAIASTCALNTICQLTPAIDNSATVTFSSTPFPITASANTPLGFLIDFHLNSVIQSDLSVNVGVSNGVTVAELPSAAPTLPPQFGSLTGTVQTVSGSQNQFTVQTADGRTFTVDSNSSTTYEDFPSSVCGAGSISCLAAGQIVEVQVAGVEANGAVLAAQVSYVQAAGEQIVEGNIVDLSTSGGATVMKLILHRDPSNSSGLTLGGEASVTIGGSATFSVDANGFTIPSGLAFTSASDLLVGQDVQVNVVAGSLNTSSNPITAGVWGPPPSLSFTTETVELEPSQITGSITAVNSSGSSFTLGSYAGLFFTSQPSGGSNLDQVNVQTTSQTTYQGFSTDSSSGLAANDMVSVNGWLFPAASSTTPPTLAANTVTLRSNRLF